MLSNELILRILTHYAAIMLPGFTDFAVEHEKYIKIKAG